MGLSHDVDRVGRSFQVVTHPTRMAFRGNVRDSLELIHDRLHGLDDFWGFPTILELEDAARVKSTWFWLNERMGPGRWSPAKWKIYHGRYRWTTPQIADMIRKLAEEGHEVGVHTSFSSLSAPELNAEDRVELTKLSGFPVAGCRQHYLSIDSPEGLSRFAAAGFEYDSSAGCPDDWGFRVGTASPFTPVLGERRLHIIEIPLTIMDRSVASSENPEALVTAALDRVAQVHGCLVVDWHSNVFGRYYDGFAETYRRILQESKSRGAWIAPLGDIAAWWRARSSNPLRSEPDHGEQPPASVPDAASPLVARSGS